MAANSYTGGTIVTAGTLTLADIDALPSGQSLTIGTQGTVVLASGLSVSAAAAIPERPQTIQQGQTATIGFWQNKHGQSLIKSLNGGAGSTQLGAWLAATFENMYGSNAGSCNLAGKTNLEIADLYTSLFKRNGKTSPGGPPKLDAQVFAVALAVYVTDENLAGSTAAAYGFHVTANGVGTAVFDVGSSNRQAFGLAETDSTQMRVLDILLATNRISGQVILRWAKRMKLSVSQEDMKSSKVLAAIASQWFTGFMLGGERKNGLPTITDPIDGFFLTWALVLRTEDSIGEGGRKRQLLLGAGETCEGTFASLCEEAQKALSGELDKGAISGDFIAVFLVKVGKHPVSGQPHLVKAVRLAMVASPVLAFDTIDLSQDEKWVPVGPGRVWSILVVAPVGGAGNADGANAFAQVLEEGKHKTQVVQGVAKATQAVNAGPCEPVIRPDLAVIYLGDVGSITREVLDELRQLLKVMERKLPRVPIVAVIPGKEHLGDLFERLHPEGLRLAVSVSAEVLVKVIDYVGPPCEAEKLYDDICYICPEDEVECVLRNQEP